MRGATRAAFIAGVTTLLGGGTARAGPNEGEAREITRDPDRVYTVVAGEGDGASTVTNPANLGFLRGLSGIADVAWTAPSARRRGSGLGLFLGIPLPLQIAALGFGYQYVYLAQPDGGGAGLGEDAQNPDDPFSKVSFALSVPLMRWVKGLSVGVSYSRLESTTNSHANGINQVDLAVSYWPTRFVALGLVGRSLNRPRTGPNREYAQPLVLDAEIALRPFGRPVFELAPGLRLAPAVDRSQARFEIFKATPRGRLFVAAGGFRFFVEAERYRFLPVLSTASDADALNAVRLTAGVELNFPHFGAAGGLITTANGPVALAAQGGMARLRLSREQYEGPAVRPRRVHRVALRDYAGDREMWQLIEHLERIGKRKGDVLLETKGMRFGWAQVEEIREAITRLRQRGGKAAAYMEGGALRHYFLASATDRIIAHPTAKLSILGMRVESFYFADLLARLGARVEFVRVAEYKGAPEKYARGGSTTAVRRQRIQLASDLWNHVLRVVARDRGHAPLAVKEWIDDAPHAPPRAMRKGIVDATAFADQLDEALAAWLGHKVRLVKPRPPRRHARDFGPQPRVGVVLVEGDLVAGESFTIPIINRRIAGSHTITKEIERLRKDPGVRAIVVRCNTPGGDPEASDAIARELDLARKLKPVVISMGDACASGGYYVATAGQQIYSDATTTTGAIGIFRLKIDLSGFLDKFGVALEAYSFGHRAGLNSWWKPFTEDERAAVQQELQDDYAVFTQRVGAARRLSLSGVDKVARGRIFSGVRAIQVGLADEYGGLREAIARARALADIVQDEGAVELVPKEPGRIETIRRIFGFQLPLPFARSLGSARFPVPWLAVLKLLPASLWLASGPKTLALADSAIVVRD